MSEVRDSPIGRSELERFFESAAVLGPLQSNYGSEQCSALARNLLASAFEQFWPKLKKHREVCAENRRRTASGFNVFDFISPSENVLSDILQFFLDPEASHGQGDIFLGLLLARVRPELSAEYKHAIVAR